MVPRGERSYICPYKEEEAPEITLQPSRVGSMANSCTKPDFPTGARTGLQEQGLAVLPAIRAALQSLVASVREAEDVRAALRRRRYAELLR